mmetsp:Transcript_36327/g.56919  ORF Transcript_36327/g.56919 Transcript_36327/m.56919 type:complete len:212 (+) Transcript_36327:42-677(+)
MMMISVLIPKMKKEKRRSDLRGMKFCRRTFKNNKRLRESDNKNSWLSLLVANSQTNKTTSTTTSVQCSLTTNTPSTSPTTKNNKRMKSTTKLERTPNFLSTKSSTSLWKGWWEMWELSSSFPKQPPLSLDTSLSLLPELEPSGRSLHKSRESKRDKEAKRCGMRQPKRTRGGMGMERRMMSSKTGLLWPSLQIRRVWVILGRRGERRRRRG